MKEKPYPFIKNRYYKGKLLRTEDFECEQEYHTQKLNMQNALFYGEGIVCGLDIQVIDKHRLFIHNGVCINQQGEFIYVPYDIDMSIEEIEGYETLLESTAYLCVQYAEKNECLQYASMSDHVDNLEHNSIQETYRLTLESSDFNQDDHLFSECILYQDEEMSIVQKIPRYISYDNQFQIEIIIVNHSQHKHNISFEYELESLELKDQTTYKNIHIYGQVQELEKEKHLYYPMTIKKTCGGTKHAHISFLKENAWIMVDGMQLSLDIVYDETLDIVDNIKSFFQQQLQQQSLCSITESHLQQKVILACIDIHRTRDHVEILSVDQSFVHRFMTQRIRHIEQTIQDAYHLKEDTISSKEEVIPIIPPSPSISDYITTGTLEIEVPEYSRHQVPVMSKAIPYQLDGHVMIVWSIETQDDFRNVQVNQYYFGDAYLFPQLEQYDYEIGCRVKESMQSFKIAVRAKKGTPKSTLKLRWYAIKTTEFLPEKTVLEPRFKMIPEFIILKPGQTQYFKLEFAKEKYKELCRFEVETHQGGSIDENGKYMAPLTKGIYKINAIGNESQYVAYAMVVVKGT